MKKMNPLTLSLILSVTVGVALASYIASRPLADDGPGQGARPATTMAIPF